MTIDPVFTRCLDTAERMFFQFGYQRVTTEEIARAAGISKKTLYELFPKKSDIIVQSLLRNGRALTAFIGACSFDARTFRQEFVDLIQMIVRMNGTYSRLLLRDLEQSDPVLIARIHRQRRRFLSERLKTILGKGLDCGIIRRAVNLDVAVVVVMLGIDDLLHPDARQSSDLPLPTARAMCSVLLDGILVHTV